MMPLSLLAIKAGPTCQTPGQTFVALPETSAMVDARGHAVDPLRVTFHDLTLVGKTREGRTRFLLDGKRLVSTAALDPFTKGGLRPLVESAVLSRLRQRYVGQVWSCGELRAVREIIHPRFSVPSFLPPGKALTILRIEQIARGPMDFGLETITDKLHNANGKLETKDFGPDDLFLVVYRLRGAQTLLFPAEEATPGWSREESQRAADIRNYTKPYNVILGAWQFERMYSTTPPSASIRRALRRCSARLERFVENPYMGMTHLQLAWQFGWPMERTSLGHTLRRDRWNYGDYYFFGFKHDRVVSYGASMMH